MTTKFTSLISPLTIGTTRLRNRIVSTGHDTGMTDHGMIGDRMIAYHAARARGGAGLIVTQVATVHETAFYTAHILQAHHDGCIPGFRRLAEAVHEEGTAIFAQLFHPGREIISGSDGTAQVAWSASAVPNERFHIMPRAMSLEMIDEIIEGYADAAARVVAAGFDGVEIVACYNYLPSQFLSPVTNRRNDAYGGDFDGRMRFLRELLRRVRVRLGPGPAVGIRMSADDMDGIGVDADLSLACCEALDREGLCDFFSIVLGSSASRGGAYHVSPPMDTPSGYCAPYAARIKAKVRAPVIIAGRINDLQIADRIIAKGQADACGMTRAMICDPDLGRKASEGRHDELRACIGCNQACIGHFFMGVPISCIQNPQSGRELEFPDPLVVSRAKRVLVAGGGPAGMKAALTAAERGHEVTLCEAGPRLGGQALLAQLLPGRAEFGGLVTNLENALRRSKAKTHLNTRVGRNTIIDMEPDAVILATGAQPFVPAIEGLEDGVIESGGAQPGTMTAWDVLQGRATPGACVLIADWRCDWIGIGLAEKLALEGHRVTLAVNGTQPGEEIMQYLRDGAAGRLFELGVEVLPYMRLFGRDEDSVYLEHSVARKPLIREGIDTLVLALGHRPVDDLARDLAGLRLRVQEIGDCLAARTAEEAVFEGMKAGLAV